MRLLLSYCKSHIYELHSILAATIAFFLMFWIKGSIKEMLARKVDEKAKKNPKWQKNKALYRKRCNGLLIIFTMLLSYLLFLILSFVSPLINFSLQSAVMSGVFAMTEYAIVDQITYGRKR